MKTHLALAFLLILSAGCRNNSTEPPLRIPPDAPSAMEKQVAASGNSFGIGLFTALARTQPEKNTIISPFSVSMALGMTLNGADGVTKTEMQQVLGVAGMTDSAINRSYHDLCSYLTQIDENVTFKNANSIWVRQAFTPLQPFMDVNREYFDAEVRSIDFSSASAAPAINGWVAEKTGNKIKEIVSDPIASDVVMILLNALYFKGSWTTKFNPALTTDDHFKSLAGADESCRMMNLEDSLLYCDGDGYQVVELPYSQKNFRMTIILPDLKKDINSFTATWTDTQWRAVRSSLQNEKGILQLPKFALEYKASLPEALKTMGMPSAFDKGAADLSRICPISGSQRLYIEKVEHRTAIEVNEEGTVAAAATSVEIGVTSMPALIVRIDRPFLFLIHETATGAILFAGKVVTLSD